MRRQMQHDEFEEEIFSKLQFRRFRVNGKALFTATAENGRYMKFSFRQQLSNHECEIFAIHVAAYPTCKKE